MAVYVLDDNNNKVEAFDKEGVLNAIEEAIKNGSLEGLVADAGFITKLKCCVSGSTNKMAFITQAKYNELVASGLVEDNTYYFIYDDTTAENIEDQIEYINNEISTISNHLQALSDGDEVVETANNATYATQAATATTVSGNSLSASQENKIITISSTGLYVCTIAKASASTGSVLYYYTALINVYDLTKTINVTVGGYTNTTTEGILRECELVYASSSKILKIENAYSTAYTYTFADCRLIAKY